MATATYAAQSTQRIAESRRSDACAATSARHAEPLAGTAGATRSWLLLEHPGPWPVNATEQALGADLIGEIGDRAPDVRVTLIRRSDQRTVERPLCVLVHTSDATPWMRQLRLDTYRDVLDLDLKGFADGIEPSVGEAVSEPLFTVCTHGKRDACCAEFGRPALNAIASGHENVWESSHIGGDRFAANLLCFPHGLYYGHLNPVAALSAANQYRDGRVQLANLRGRSGREPAAQAAEHYVRTATGIDGVDDVTSNAPIPTADDSVDVDVRAAGTWYHVSLRSESVDAAITAGCGKDSVARVGWSLVSLQRSDTTAR